MPSPIRKPDAIRFFVPLIFTSQLMMFSHSIIHAFLARLSAPKISLAAFSATHSLFSMVGSPTVTAPLIALSFLRDRRSVRRLLVFNGAILLLPFAVMMLAATQGVGEWVFGEILGVSPEVTRQARNATLLFTLAMPVIMVRAISFALIMSTRRTLLITYGSMVRLASLAVYLLVLPRWLDGAALGSAALVLCMSTETVYSVLISRPFYRDLPEGSGEQPSYVDMWRHSWPLMMGQLSESGVLFAINVFLGRLANPDLALAAFGVVRGLMGLLLSPLRNLVQTTVALVRSSDEAAVMWRFSIQVGLIFSGLVGVLFFTPLRSVVLDDIMGLTPELSVYCAPGLRMLVAVPLVWALSATARGLLTAARHTRAIAASSTLRIGAVMAVASLTLLGPEFNGTMVGVAAMATAFLAEALLLSRVLYRRHASSGLFAGETPAAGRNEGQ